MGQPVREETLERVGHPDPLVLHGRRLTRIDDPLAAPIATGDPTFGWEGDPRLQLYLDRPGREWVLVRFEHDRVYRIVVGHDAGDCAGMFVAARMIEWLVAHDQRRGYDVLADVAATNAAVDRSKEAAATEFNEEFAHRLRHGLRKDGVV